MSKNNKLKTNCCAHIFHTNFKSTLYKLFLQSHFDYCSTVFAKLSMTSNKRLLNCSRRALFKLLKVNIKNLDIGQQLAALAPYNILPIPLRRLYRFTTYVFSICRFKTSPLFDHIVMFKSFRPSSRSFIHPPCRTNLRLSSFSFVAIKLLNHLLKTLLSDFDTFRQLPKNDFSQFLKLKILSLYEQTSDFFS